MAGKNSLIVAVVCVLLLALAIGVSGSVGCVWYIVGFFAGGVGTAVNVAKASKEGRL